MAGLRLSPQQQKQLRDFFRGLKNAFSLQLHAGTRRLETGQDSLSYTSYVWLMQYFLDKGDVFAFGFGLVSWNSLCRRNNVAAIRLQHLVPSKDKIDLYTPRTKTDRIGARAKTPIGLFSNPNDARQCCLLGLALVLAQQEGQRAEDADLLFRGSSQASRFAACIHDAFASCEGQAWLAQQGGHALQLSAHSFRKGSKNWLEECRAPHVAKMSRGGWSTGAVAQAYDRAGLSGDSECGRLAAGLHKTSYEDFALLPPHFAPGDVSDADVLRCFPAFYQQPAMLPLLRALLAPFVHHVPALLPQLPLGARLRQHPLLAQPAFARHLASKLVVGLDSPYMSATGIPDDLVGRRQAAIQLRTLFDERLPAGVVEDGLPVPRAPSTPMSIVAIDPLQQVKVPPPLPLSQCLPRRVGEQRPACERGVP